MWALAVAKGDQVAALQNRVTDIVPSHNHGPPIVEDGQLCDPGIQVVGFSSP